MSKTRVYRTREQRIADAKAIIAKEEAAADAEIQNLRDKAKGWYARAAELTEKADQAVAKADELEQPEV